MDQSTSDLLGQTYGCVRNPELWPDVLERFRAMLGIRSAIVHNARRDTRRLTTHWMASDHKTIAAGAAPPISDADNPRMDARHSPPKPGVTFFLDEEALPGRDRNVLYMHDRLASLGWRSFLGARMELDDGHTLLLALHGDADKSWTAEGKTREAVALFVPHLCEVLKMSPDRAGLNRREQAILGMMDRLGCGIALMDANGMALDVNETVKRMLIRQRHLMLIDGQLMGRSPNDETRLRSLLSAASNGDSAGAVFGPGNEAIHILAMPLTSLNAGRQGALLLFSAAHERTKMSSALLGPLYGLTGAEARLTAALCGGATLKDYADQRGISVFTARFQLKQILAKTGTLRQSDLVGMICSSSVARLRQAESDAGTFRWV